MMARKHIMQTWTSSFWLTMREFRRVFLLWAGVNLGGVQRRRQRSEPQTWLPSPPTTQMASGTRGGHIYAAKESGCGQEGVLSPEAWGLACRGGCEQGFRKAKTLNSNLAFKRVTVLWAWRANKKR